MIKNFDCTVDYLPTSIVYLKLGTGVNRVCDKLLHSLKWLFFGATFNQPVNNLPPNLIQVSFGSEFNQELEGKLPAKLKSLSIGVYFQKKISSYLMQLKLLVIRPPVKYLLFLSKIFGKL